MKTEKTVQSAVAELKASVEQQIRKDDIHDVEVVVTPQEDDKGELWVRLEIPDILSEVEKSALLNILMNIELLFDHQGELYGVNTDTSNVEPEKIVIPEEKEETI